MTINYIKVRNIPEAAGYPPPDENTTWLDFWKLKNPFYMPSSCSNRNCTSQADLQGAHVQVPGEAKRYIIPLCGACCKLQDEFEVAEYKLTPVARN